MHAALRWEDTACSSAHPQGPGHCDVCASVQHRAPGRRTRTPASQAARSRARPRRSPGWPTTRRQGGRTWASNSRSSTRALQAMPVDRLKPASSSYAASERRSGRRSRRATSSCSAPHRLGAALPGSAAPCPALAAHSSSSQPSCSPPAALPRAPAPVLGACPASACPPPAPPTAAAAVGAGGPAMLPVPLPAVAWCASAWPAANCWAMASAAASPTYRPGPGYMALCTCGGSGRRWA